MTDDKTTSTSTDAYDRGMRRGIEAGQARYGTPPLPTRLTTGQVPMGVIATAIRGAAGGK